MGRDAPSYAEALKVAIRHDPDVIMVGDVPDRETAATALRAAETGQLVICNLRGSGARETVQHFLDLFAEEGALVAQQMLAASLIGVVSQRLLPTADGQRRLNAELLVNNARTRDVLRDARNVADQLDQVIAEGGYDGMRSFNQCLAAQVRDGVLERSQAESFATDAQEFKLLMAAATAGSNGGDGDGWPFGRY